MDKLRFKLLIALIIIFAVTSIAFVMTLFSGDAAEVSGSAVGPSGTPISLGIVVPGILFIGFLILTVFYLEKK